MIKFLLPAILIVTVLLLYYNNEEHFQKYYRDILGLKAWQSEETASKNRFQERGLQVAVFLGGVTVAVVVCFIVGWSATNFHGASPEKIIKQCLAHQNQLENRLINLETRMTMLERLFHQGMTIDTLYTCEIKESPTIDAELWPNIQMTMLERVIHPDMTIDTLYTCETKESPTIDAELWPNIQATDRNSQTNALNKSVEISNGTMHENTSKPQKIVEATEIGNDATVNDNSTTPHSEFFETQGDSCSLKTQIDDGLTSVVQGNDINFEGTDYSTCPVETENIPVHLEIDVECTLEVDSECFSGNSETTYSPRIKKETVTVLNAVMTDSTLPVECDTKINHTKRIPQYLGNRKSKERKLRVLQENDKSEENNISFKRQGKISEPLISEIPRPHRVVTPSSKIGSLSADAVEVSPNKRRRQKVLAPNK